MYFKQLKENSLIPLKPNTNDTSIYVYIIFSSKVKEVKMQEAYKHHPFRVNQYAFSLYWILFSAYV